MHAKRRLPTVLIALAVCAVVALLWSWFFDHDAGAVTTSDDSTAAFEEIEADLLRQLREDAEARNIPGLRTRGGGVGILSGRVMRVLRDQGLVPVPGVEVQMLWHRDASVVVLEDDPAHARQRAQVVTNAEGVFRFERLPASVGGVLVIRHEPFKPILRRGVNVFRDRETDLGDLVLGAPTTLQGEVLDDKGRALRHARVQVLDDRSRPGRFDIGQVIQQVKGAATPLAEVEVDDQGRFVVRDLPPGRYLLRASARGYATAFRANVVVTLDERSSAVRLVLDRGAGFEGRVVDELGNGISGANLIAGLVTGARMQRVDRIDGTTDAGGNYSLDQLVPGSRYFLHAWAEGYAPFTAMVVPKDGRTTRDITLVPSGRVEGQIVDADSGAPIGGAEVTLLTGTIVNPGPVAEVTNAEGRFVFAHVRPGPIIVFTAAAPGYQQHLEFQAASIRGMSVKPGETTTLDWQLHEGGKVTGRVTSADGAPAPHASVALVPRNRWMSELTTLTEVDGRYEIVGVKSGEYHLRVSAAGLSPIVKDDDAKVRMSDTLGAIEKDIVLDTGAVLRGVVTSPDGQPVSGARVFLEAKGSRAVRDRVRDLEAISGPTGTYRILGVPPGVELTLVAEHDAYVRTSSAGMRLTPGEVREIAVALRAGAVIEVTVVDHNQQPNDKPRVRRGHVGPDDERRARDSFRADELLSPRVLRTDVRGFVRADGLRPGKLLVKVELEGYAPWYRRDAQVPDEGNPEPVRAQLIPSMEIRGHVLSSAAGRPVEAAFVYARERRRADEPDLGRVQAVVSAETTPDGAFRLVGMAPGAYEVVVWFAAGHIGELNDRKNEHIRRDARAGATRLEFRLDPLTVPLPK